MTFDTPVNRVGSNASKWDLMERAFGVSPKDGLAMWIADMDFKAPEFLQSAVQGLLDKANYGYFTGVDAFEDSVVWWMKNRHGWEMDPSWMSVTYGLGNGIALTINALTEPGDAIATFTPVYHEFQRKIEKAGRMNTQLPLVQDASGLYRMDFDAYEALFTGKEKVLLISSPHNPAGRVWEHRELKDIAAFCQKHDLLLISDEVHQDLTFSGQKHLMAPLAIPEMIDRMVVTTAGSKTFNIAGARTGCIIIPNAELRAKFRKLYNALDMNPNLFGIELTRAAYSPDGAAWVDDLMTYLEGNYHTFRNGLAAASDITLMPMQSTYLSWIDFSRTGLDQAEIYDRVYKQAKLAPTPGKDLGKGGEMYLRFNLGTQRANVTEAAKRLVDVFAR